MLSNDLEFAINLIKENTSLSNNKLYSFSNENLIDLFKALKVTNKSVLCVLASSDQVLDSLLFNAKNIATFDINPLTKHFFELKKAALLANLSLNEFLIFFDIFYPDDGYPNLKIDYKEKLFNKFKDYLKIESLNFWQYLINKFNIYQVLSIMKMFYYPVSLATYQKNINYLNSVKNFEKLKDIITNQDINFKNCDILNFKDDKKNCYDLIYLSNIIDYISLNNYENVIANLDNYLKQNGQVVSYLFEDRRFDKEQELLKLINNNYKIKSLTKVPHKKQDKILVYTKPTHT